MRHTLYKEKLLKLSSKKRSSLSKQTETHRGEETLLRNDSQNLFLIPRGIHDNNNFENA